MSEAVKKQRAYAVAKCGMVCYICGKPLNKSTMQMAHKIGNTIQNRKKYGDFVIDHIMNVEMTCSLGCNSQVDISKDTGKCIRLIKSIYDFEIKKYL